MVNNNYKEQLLKVYGNSIPKEVDAILQSKNVFTPSKKSINSKKSTNSENKD